MTPGEAYRERSRALMDRSDALHVADGKERKARSIVNLTTYVAGLGLLATQWANLDARVLFGVVMIAIVLRILGNGIVGAWCNAELRRIDVAYPKPEPLPLPGAGPRQGPATEKGKER